MLLEIRSKSRTQVHDTAKTEHGFKDSEHCHLLGLVALTALGTNQHAVQDTRFEYY